MNADRTWRTLTQRIADLEKQVNVFRRRARYQEERAEHWKHRALKGRVKR